MGKLVALKELRNHVSEFAAKVGRGESFVVLRKSKPLFKIVPVDFGEEEWEPVADFTRIRKGGIKLEELLARL